MFLVVVAMADEICIFDCVRDMKWVEKIVKE
jgi:hypothetical protein